MDDLHKKKEVLNSWLERYKKLESFSIDLSQMYETTEKQIEIVDNLPTGYDQIKIDLTGLFSSDLNYIEKTLPEISVPFNYLDTSLVAMHISGSTSGYSYIQDLYIPESFFGSWQNNALQDFELIQERQNRFSKIIDMVRLFDDDIANEFFEAKNKYQQFKQGLICAEGIALALRNPMEHLKGRLWAKTITIYKSETSKNPQMKFSWDTVAEFIVKNGKGSSESFEFINRCNDFKSLWSFLSSLLKKCAVYTNDYIKEQIVKYIDTLFSMLNFVNMEKIKNVT